ncbi:MAG: MBL fold metallo-hydrolase [Clostridia bacterium]|nr:MBL fold metallo-hydrolase [Clostridia bacterium]
MELRFSPLFSGSSGNAIYVGCDDAHILVDAGMSGTRVSQELTRVGIDPRCLNAILVTHEHADHIKGIGILSRKYDLPVFATEGTWQGMYAKIGPIADKNRILFESNQDFFLGSINVTPFSIPHDAAEPVGYTFEVDGAKLAIATDLGCVRDGWFNHVLGSDAVILESNYDPDMLKAGPYPYELKKRIMSRHGHLSNDDAGRVAAELVRNGTQQIILGHLSKENNFPDLAMRTCELYLQQAGFAPHEDALLYVARRDGATGMFSISAEMI